MGDNLGDEWWVDSGDDVDNVTTEELNDEVNPQTEKTTTAAVLKRKCETSITSTNDEGSKKNKRKRRTKQKISDHLKKNAPRPSSTREVITIMETYFKEKLSPIELEDVQLSESHFLEPNLSSLGLPAYLEMAVPNWARDIEAKRPKASKTCLLLIITSSGKRAVDLNREAAPFKGKQCVSTKLFAKHIKIQEQINFLAKHRTQFAVGTPSRIAALLQQDSLTLDGTRYVVLDWNWRDVKYRRICDMPELKAELLGLFEKYIIPCAKSDEARLKIGIF